MVSVNKYKQELAALQVIVCDEQDSHKLAISAVGQLKAEVASLKQENDGLKKLLDELKSFQDQSAKVPSRFIDKVTKTLDRSYIPIVMALHRRLSTAYTAETMELV